MATDSAATRPKATIYQTIDVAIERVIGADFRLIYGMAVPILILCGLIIALAAYPKAWVVGILVVLEIGTLAMIVRGFMDMMDSDDDGQGEPSH